jgi:hypothetical protein
MMKYNNPAITINQKFITITKSNRIDDDKQILSTKLSIEDDNAFLMLTKLEYQAG